MSDPCAGPGATHYACPCQLQRLAALEAAEAACEAYLDLITHAGIERKDVFQARWAAWLATRAKPQSQEVRHG